MGQMVIVFLKKRELLYYYESPEVYTNIVFENITTMPLELCAGIKRTIEKTSDVTVVDTPEYGDHIRPLSD